jgi:hypothetical protein
MTTMSVIRRSVLAPGAALLLPAYLSGCFHYVPGSVEPLPGPRTEVQVHLTQPLRVPLGEVTLEEVTAIEGVVSDASSDTLGVYAKWLYPRVGRKYDALGATFRVAAGSISQVEQWRFSPQRTALVAVIAGAVVYGFLQGVRLAKSADTPGGGPIDNQSIRGWLRE